MHWEPDIDQWSHRTPLSRMIPALAAARVMARLYPLSASRGWLHGRSSGRASRLFRRIVRALWRKRRRSATIRALEGLSDTALKDIGLHRCEIHSLVHYPDERFRG
jgi:uncharacterized protein YjiS (DUF1127 family)